MSHFAKTKQGKGIASISWLLKLIPSIGLEESCELAEITKKTVLKLRRLLTFISGLVLEL